MSLPLGSACGSPRKNPRALRASHHAQIRRNEALDRQQSSRVDAIARARQLAQASLHEDVDMATHSQSDAISHRQPGSPSAGTSDTREQWAKQLMRPEWLIDLPHDLRSQWIVLPRPEGRRCLLVAAGGSTTARSRSGIQFARFPSALPGGSRHTQGTGDTFCILDAIYHAENSTYYVMDLMCWKGYPLYNCNAEFRMFWMTSKLVEETDAATAGSSHNAFAIAAVPLYQAHVEGLKAAHSAAAMPFVRDGIMLLHKEGRYLAGASSPLALLWKDAASSRFLLDTDSSGVVPQLQQVVLEYREGGDLVTSDDDAIVVAHMPQLASPSIVGPAGQPTPHVAPGKLLRFSIGPKEMQLAEGYRPVAVDLILEGSALGRRGRADPWSKILFQYQSRRAPVTLATLLEAVADQPMWTT